MISTFTDQGQTLVDYTETIYVHCPVCQKSAHVRRIPSNDGTLHFQQIFSPRKLSCLHCGYTKTWEGKSYVVGGPRDPYFRLPLWLQTPCCGEILWAFNEEHLSYLEKYVTATQRLKFNEHGQRRNGSMASRLPLWMKSAKNRDEVIKGIMRLKAVLAGA